LLNIPSIDIVCGIEPPALAELANGEKPTTRPLREFTKFFALTPIGCPVLADISLDVINESADNAPAPAEILPH
jgi:hypothetical protein